MEVKHALFDYLAANRHLAYRSLLLYQQRLSVFVQWCASHHVSLEQVNNRQVQAFLEHLRASHAPRKPERTELSTETTAGYVRAIQAFLHWCTSDKEYSQYVKLSYVKGIKMTRIEKHLADIFSDAELGALFASA